MKDADKKAVGVSPLISRATPHRPPDRLLICAGLNILWQMNTHFNKNNIKCYLVVYHEPI